MIHRRGLLTGLICLMAAPAIVRATSLMPVKVMKPAEFNFLKAGQWIISGRDAFGEYKEEYLRGALAPQWNNLYSGRTGFKTIGKITAPGGILWSTTEVDTKPQYEDGCMIDMSPNSEIIHTAGQPPFGIRIINDDES